MPSCVRYVLSAPLATLLFTAVQAQIDPYWCDNTIASEPCVDKAFSAKYDNGQLVYDFRQNVEDAASSSLSAGLFDTDFVIANNNGYRPYYDAKEDAYAFTVNAKNLSMTAISSWYILYGEINITMKAAPNAGAASAMVMHSDTRAELDWEILGGLQSSVPQTNYYPAGPKGSQVSYPQSVFGSGYTTDANSPTKNYKTYSMKYTKEDGVTWSIDGFPWRYDTKKNLPDSPQYPFYLRLGLWLPGASENQGTRDWAGGSLDQSGGDFTMFIKNISVADYSNGQTYKYTKQTTGVEAIGGPVTAAGNGKNGKNGVFPFSIYTSVDDSAVGTDGTKVKDGGNAGSGPSPGSTSGGDTGASGNACYTVTGDVSALSSYTPSVVTSIITDSAGSALTSAVTDYAAAYTVATGTANEYVLANSAGTIICPKATDTGAAKAKRTLAPEPVLVQRQVQPSWTATTACTTQGYNANAASGFKYYATSFWNDQGAYVTSLAVLGARTTYDNNGFPVTVLPNNAGQVYCTTSVSYYSQAVATGISTVNPSTFQTVNPTAIQTVNPSQFASTAPVVSFSEPVAGSGTPSSSAGGQETSAPAAMGNSASGARLGLFDPILFTLAGLGVGLLAVVAAL